MSASSDDRRLRSVKLPSAQLDVLLNRLDNEASSHAAERRQHRRYAYRVHSCSVKLQQPGSPSPAHYLVQTRNLSKGGMAFLHGGFVHAGTRCLVQPIRRDGQWTEVLARVVACRYLEQGVHEVCIQFDREIDPADYCEGATTYDFLLVDDDDALARLAAHHLSSLNVEVTRVTNGEEAVAATRSRQYDCVLLDMDMPVMDGFQAAQAMRDASYRGLIVAMTGMDRDEDRQRALAAGCDDFVTKPANAGTFRRIIESIDREPIISKYQDDPAMAEMIADFVATLPAQIRELQALAASAEDPDRLASTARRLKSEGGSYGFDPIFLAAAEIERGVREGDDPAGIVEQAERLAALARQVRGPEAASDRAEDGPAPGGLLSDDG